MCSLLNINRYYKLKVDYSDGSNKLLLSYSLILVRKRELPFASNSGHSLTTAFCEAFALVHSEAPKTVRGSGGRLATEVHVGGTAWDYVAVWGYAMEAKL